MNDVEHIKTEIENLCSISDGYSFSKTVTANGNYGRIRGCGVTTSYKIYNSGRLVFIADVAGYEGKTKRCKHYKKLVELKLQIEKELFEGLREQVSQKLRLREDEESVYL